MTISKLSQRNQFPTRSANQFPSCREQCSCSTTSVFARKPCTVWSTLQEDGIIVLPPIFETWKGEESLMEPCSKTFGDENGRHSGLVFGVR